MKAIAIPLTLLIGLVFSLPALQAMSEIDINKFYTEKKALVKETVPLTEKERQAFWPLYDDYMKGFAIRINQRIEYERGFAKNTETMTEEQAREAIGVAVVGGMIAATVMSLLFTPVFFVVMQKLSGFRKKNPEEEKPAKEKADVKQALRGMHL